MKRAPITCRAGISRGKLKGVMRPTGPKGHLYPLLCWPGWSPDCPNDLAANLTYRIQTIPGKKKRKGRFMLFSDQNGSLLKQQPGATIVVHSC